MNDECGLSKRKSWISIQLKWLCKSDRFWMYKNCQNPTIFDFGFKLPHNAKHNIADWFLITLCWQLPDNSPTGGVVGWVLDQCQSVTESEASYIWMHYSAATANRRYCCTAWGSSDTEVGYPLTMSAPCGLWGVMHPWFIFFILALYRLFAFSLGFPTCFLFSLLIMAILCSRCRHYIFVQWFLFLLFCLADWIFTILLHVVWP